MFGLYAYGRGSLKLSLMPSGLCPAGTSLDSDKRLVGRSMMRGASLHEEVDDSSIALESFMSGSLVHGSSYGSGDGVGSGLSSRHCIDSAQRLRCCSIRCCIGVQQHCTLCALCQRVLAQFASTPTMGSPVLSVFSARHARLVSISLDGSTACIACGGKFRDASVPASADESVACRVSDGDLSGAQRHAIVRRVCGEVPQRRVVVA